MEAVLSWVLSREGRRGLLCGALVFIIGCGAPFVAEKNDARDFLDESLPVGTRLSTAINFLRAREFKFNLFTRQQCQGFVIEPRFHCRGGSALFVELEEGLLSWRRPGYSPNLQSFLAFDADERLTESIIFLDGG